MKRVVSRMLACAPMVAVAGTSVALPINGRVPVKTFTVGPVGTVNPEAGIANDFTFLNSVYQQVGIRFDQAPDTFVQIATPAVGGQWNPYEFTNTLNTVARRQNTGFAYFVLPGNTWDNAGTSTAQTWSQEDVGTNETDPNSAATAAVAVRTIAASATRRRNDTLPHEAGHMLSNRYQWRTSERTNPFHSNNVDDLMTPNTQAPAAADIWPAGNKTQIRHNVGQFSNDANKRIPFITAMYNDGAAGSAQPMFSGINRDAMQINMGQNLSTSVDNTLWGNTLSITKPVAAGGGGGTRTYSVDQTARRERDSKESLSFFITSPSALTIAGDLNQGWSFGAIGIDSLDGMYVQDSAISVSIRGWSDILGPGGTASNGGVGVLVDPTKYSVSGSINAFGSLTFDVFFFSADAVVLAGYRDLQVTATVNWIPAPGTGALLAMAGVVMGRRRRR